MDFFEESFLRNNTALFEHPYICPLKAKTLAGLPPAHIILASHDPLKDDGKMFYEALREAGVDAHLSYFDAQVHAFFSFDFLPAALTARTEAIQRIRNSLSIRLKDR